MKNKLIPQELRIGNWVQAPLGEIMQVTILGHPEFPDYIFAKNETGFGQNEFYGIGLTPSILEKCGFVQQRENKNLFFFNEFRFSNNEKQISLLRPCDKAGERQKENCGFPFLTDKIKVEYVHQLQNLYFALTSTELEIKL